MLGSSRMYSTPCNPDPICVASRMRCASPPDSVSALRDSVRYSSPTSSMNFSRALISRRIGSLIIDFVLSSRSPAKNSVSFTTDMAVISAMLSPPTRTDSASFLSRRPLQTGHGRLRMNRSMSLLTQSLDVSR